MTNANIDPRIINAIDRIKDISQKYPNDANSLKEKVYKLLCLLVNPSQNRSQTDPSSTQSAASFELPRSQNESERKKIDERLRGFSLNESKAWKGICERFGPNLNQSELLSIAEVLCSEVNQIPRNMPLKVDREAKRRKEVLIKWFDENFTDLQPHMKTIILEDENGEIIDSRRY